MSVAVKPPSPVLAPLLEWRARRIHDPIERLRFLRTASTPVSRPVSLAKVLKRWRWGACMSMILWACFFVPAPGPSTIRAPVLVRPAPAALPAESPVAAVWPVEQKDSFEIYSNGLRVEKEFVTSNRPRNTYPVFRRLEPAVHGTREEAFDTRSVPAGIVFHSTETHQAPFEPAETRNLKRIGRNLLDYVRSRRSYHYVIDRFGGVYRVVRESDTANHAGKSVWADAGGTYMYLNDSFIGIAIESQTDAAPSVNTAQLHAARVLTEMLRGKYKIPASNCVTHAQVSVNPSNYRIGYHTDWAVGFPFEAVGLPDNYRQPLVSMYAFGFEYDDSFLSAAGDRRWPGLLASQRQVREQALAAGVPAAEYQRHLQQRFQRILNSAAMRERGEEQ